MVITKSQGEEHGMRTRDVSAGAPCWIDLNTSDTAAAREFYTGVFGWTAGQASEEFGGYFMFEHKGSPVAGCMPAMPGAPADLWSVYLTVTDASKTVEAATANGGQVAVPAMTVADTGTMAMVVDPGGSVIGLWQPDQFTGITNRDDAGLPSWFELHTADYAGVLPFYREVFGWTISTMMDTPEFKYSVLERDEDQLAGIMDASGTPDARLGWTFYIWVDDADATAARVTEHGGSVLEQPVDTPYGRLATVADPHGAVFKVMAGNDQMPG
jgi:predicted enzyme related to lactoylglutathione lyase